jgi:integron integrase
MTAQPKKLLDCMREALRVKHYSIRTEQTYVNWAKRYILFHDKRHPKDMGSQEIAAFLTHLAVQRNVAASTQNQALCALLFLYKEVLHQDVGPVDAVRAKKPKRLPTVLTKDEVERVVAAVTGTHRLVVRLLYGSGLRLMECLRLRVKDVDFAYRQITVRDGKGRKDRVTVLPGKLVEPLKTHLRHVALIHQRDLDRGYGAVYLPYALEVKYPNAAKEWGWQYVFPARSLSRDPPAPVSPAAITWERAVHSAPSGGPPA